MIQVSKVDVWGFEHAIRGMRNPLNSWDKSDSKYVNFCDNGFEHPNYQKFEVGPNDLDLMKRLYKASLFGDNHAHRKYLRQIMVSMDILAPRYWWVEADTYKVGTTANSTSTMHRITSKEFTISDFSYEHIIDDERFSYMQDWSEESPLNFMEYIVEMLNSIRRKYVETKDKKYWWQLIQLLPQSYNQLRTVTMNYENVFTMINQREGHKLDEWNQFVDVLRNLPPSEL